MRIAMVSEHASPLALIAGEDAGGQNVHVAELATALARRGHDVVVHTRRTDPTTPDTVRFRDGVRVRHLGAGPAAPLAKDLLLPHMGEFERALTEALAHDRPDAVHAHFWMSGMAATGAGAALGIPVFQTFHALGAVKQRFQGIADTSPPERDRIEPAVARACDMVVATSEEERNELLTWGVESARIAVVPCGADTERFTRSGPSARRNGRPRLLSLGRLVPRKGVDTVIRALATVPDAELFVVGGPRPDEMTDDPEVVRLRTIALRLGVADRVRFLGCVDREEVPALVRSADLSVNVPWYEPFGISTVESMACGVPVIASRVGGHRDTVVHGETGLLVPARSPGRLAEKIRRLLAEPDTRGFYSEASERRARERYSWSEVARATEQCYRSQAPRAVLPRDPEHDRLTEQTAATTAGGEES